MTLVVVQKKNRKTNFNCLQIRLAGLFAFSMSAPIQTQSSAKIISLTVKSRLELSGVSDCNMSEKFIYLHEIRFTDR
jgi:hypothetical protein